MTKQDIKRNVRNNNPLNLRENHRVDYDWVGEHALDLDPEFEEFKTAEYGFRAAYKTLMTYRNKRGAKTVSSVIERWAPRDDNNNHNDRYIDFVARAAGIDAHEIIPMHAYPEIMYAMAEFEGAKGAFNMQQVYGGIALA